MQQFLEVFSQHHV